MVEFGDSFCWLRAGQDRVESQDFDVIGVFRPFKQRNPMLLL